MTGPTLRASSTIESPNLFHTYLISRGDEIHGQRSDDPDPEQRPYVHAADRGLSGAAVDALQGVRPQQHHQLPDRGVQVDRRQSVRDGQDERHRLLEQDAGLLPPGQPRLQCAARPHAVGGDRGHGGQLQAAVHRHQRRRRHGQYRHGAVQAHLPPQRADRLHHREQRLLRPDQGPVLGDGRPEPAPAAPDRRGQRHSSVRPVRRGDRRRGAPSWRGRSPATRSRWSRC